MPPPLGSPAPLLPHLDQGRPHSRPGRGRTSPCCAGRGSGWGTPTTSSHRPTHSPERVSLERLFPPRDALLVTGSQAGGRSESGKYLVPGLIQDTEPTALTQLVARGLHN